MSILVRWKNELTWTMFTYQSFTLGYIFIYVFLQSLYIKGKYSLISCEDAWLGHVFKPKHAPECQMRSVLRNPALQCSVSFMRIHAGLCEATHFIFIFFYKKEIRSSWGALTVPASPEPGRFPEGPGKNKIWRAKGLRFGLARGCITLRCVCVKGWVKKYGWLVGERAE